MLLHYTHCATSHVIYTCAAAKTKVLYIEQAVFILWVCTEKQTKLDSCKPKLNYTVPYFPEYKSHPYVRPVTHGFV